MKRLINGGSFQMSRCGTWFIAALTIICFGVSEGHSEYTITYLPTSVDEGDNITVTVTRGSVSDPDTVIIRTVPGSALPSTAIFPYPDYDDGEMPLITSFIDPPDPDASADFIISINDDDFFENDEDFFVQVLNGTTILAETQIVINANDSNGKVEVIPDTNSTIPLPDDFDDRGTIVVNSTSAPPGAAWRLVGETKWRDMNTSVSDALVVAFDGGTVVPDAHEIEFLPVPGFNLDFIGSTIDPLSKQIVVPDNNTTVTVTVNYSQNFNPIGDLQVDLYPDDVRTSTPVGAWRIRNYDISPADGIDDQFLHGASLPLPAGFYEIYFDEVDGFEVPRPRIVQVVGDQKSIIEATYLRNEAAGDGTVNPLAPLDYFDISVSTPGLQGTGQVRTNIAKATGVAVGKNTVLTTAQAIFNPKRLASTYKIRWILQRQTTGNLTSTSNNPPPQIPRGWYLFNDYSSGLSSNNAGDITTNDLENSVAALFFKVRSARGGLAGYLGSSLAQSTPFIENSTFTKFLAGYGLSENTGSASAQANDGILLKSPDLNIALTSIGGNLYRGGPFSNQVSGTEVGSFLGTALFIRDTRDSLNINDIPAGIVVGTQDFNGSEELVIRAFDPVLAEMVQRAVFSGLTEIIYNNDPSTTSIVDIPDDDDVITPSNFSALGGLGGGFGGSGGGGFGDEATTGSLAVTLDPSDAVTQGAQWGFESESPTYRDSGDQVDDLIDGFYTNLIYNDTGGYDSPTSNSYTIVSEQTTEASKSYSENEELLWIQSNFDTGDWETASIVTATANPDGDPFNNALERALNGDPEASDDLLNLTAEADSLEITVNPDTSQEDMTLTIYMGSTPSEATGKSTIAAQTNEGMSIWPTTGTNVSVTDNGGGSWTIEDTNTGGARFMHIEATSSNPDYSP